MAKFKTVGIKEDPDAIGITNCDHRLVGKIKRQQSGKWFWRVLKPCDLPFHPAGVEPNREYAEQAVIDELNQLTYENIRTH